MRYRDHKLVESPSRRHLILTNFKFLQKAKGFNRLTYSYKQLPTSATHCYLLISSSHYLLEIKLSHFALPTYKQRNCTESHFWWTIFQWQRKREDSRLPPLGNLTLLIDAISLSIPALVEPKSAKKVSSGNFQPPTFNPERKRRFCQVLIERKSQERAKKFFG